MKTNKTHPTWGGRFQKPLDLKASEFLTSLHFDKKLYECDILGSLAHVKMLEKQGMINQEEAKKISDGLKIIKRQIQHSEVELNPALEDIHMNIEYLLEKQIGESAKKLHTGRSRNDQVALDLRLYTRQSIDYIQEQLKVLEKTFNEIIDKHDSTIMPGYTHLQQAQPISLAQFFDAYKAMIKRDCDRFENCRDRLNFSPLGAGALAGSSLPLNRHFVAAELDFSGIINNTLDAVSDRDFIIEFCAASSILMMHLSRLCEDIILYCTIEFSFITLDDAFATGSSLMPNKRNPDIAELIRGKSGRIFGHLMAILTVMKGLPLCYNKDLQEDKEALFDTVDTLSACLNILPDFLKSLTFNTQIMKKAVEQSFMDATSWVEKLVLKGIPFRTAHQVVGEWVAQGIKEGKTLCEIAIEYGQFT